MEGMNHLIAAIGSRELASEIVQLAEFLQIQPKTCYVAFTFGLKHHWTYFLGKLPDIQDLLESLNIATSLVLIHIFASQCHNMVKWLTFGIQNECNFKPYEACYVNAVQMFFAARRIISKQIWPVLTKVFSTLKTKQFPLNRYFGTNNSIYRRSVDK